jgi:stage II sporulation protein P
LAETLRQAKGLPSALLNWELGGLTPARGRTAEVMLLGMELGISAGAEDPLEAPTEDKPRTPDLEPLSETPHYEEPGLSVTEPADDIPPPVEPVKPAPVSTPIEVTLKAGSGSNFLRSGDVVIRNETTITIDMDKVMSRKLALTRPKDKPQILIVHTHATEAYWTYDKDSVTVVSIGARLKVLLEEQGFNVIHDATVYSQPDFNRSYSSALTGITKTLKENPGIGVIFDIHRDAIEAPGKPTRKPVVAVGGEKLAQMMFVVGTNNSGLPHDDWPQNLCLAVQLQKRLADGAPDFMRPINLRKERFNQHAAKGSLILEVGSVGNNSEEAMRSIDLFAAKAGPVLKDLIN